VKGSWHFACKLAYIINHPASGNTYARFSLGLEPGHIIIEHKRIARKDANTSDQVSFKETLAGASTYPTSQTCDSKRLARNPAWPMARLRKPSMTWM